MEKRSFGHDAEYPTHHRDDETNRFARDSGDESLTGPERSVSVAIAEIRAAFNGRTHAKGRESAMDHNDRSDTGAPRVLIVDDTPETRDILRHMVTIAGGTVVATLDSGSQAAAVIQQTPVDLVFLDYQMAGWSGLTTAQHLHTQWPLLPLVMITVMADPATRQAAFDAGVRHFLGKPVTVDEIRTVLRTVKATAARGTPDEWAAWVRPFESEETP